MRKNVWVDRALALIGVISFRLALDLAYIDIVYPVYGSTGFDFSPTLLAYVESLVALVSVAIVALIGKQRVASMAFQFLFVIAYVPLTSLYAMTSAGRSVLWLGLVFWCIAKLISLSPLSASSLTLVRSKFISPLICWIMAVTGLILCFQAFGFTLNFDLYEVYVFRAERGFELIPLGRYLIPWAAKIAVPFLALYGWFNRSQFWYVWFFVPALFQILFFAVTGHKTFLFMLPALFLLSWLVTKRRFLFLFSSALSLGIFLSLAVDNWVGGYILNGMFTRRVFFVPANLTMVYFDFFESNYLYLSHSVLSPIFEYPYALNTAKLVGYQYFGHADFAANTGILADGFMNFGIIGIFAWACMFGMLLAMSDVICRQKDARIVYPVIILAMYTFVNGALFTTLLTHGLLFSMLVIGLVPKNRSLSRISI